MSQRAKIHFWKRHILNTISQVVKPRHKSSLDTWKFGKLYQKLCLRDRWTAKKCKNKVCNIFFELKQMFFMTEFILCEFNVGLIVLLRGASALQPAGHSRAFKLSGISVTCRSLHKMRGKYKGWLARLNWLVMIKFSLNPQGGGNLCSNIQMLRFHFYSIIDL